MWRSKTSDPNIRKLTSPQECVGVVQRGMARDGIIVQLEQRALDDLSWR